MTIFTCHSIGYYVCVSVISFRCTEHSVFFVFVFVSNAIMVALGFGVCIE